MMTSLWQCRWSPSSRPPPTSSIPSQMVNCNPGRIALRCLAEWAGGWILRKGFRDPPLPPSSVKEGKLSTGPAVVIPYEQAQKNPLKMVAWRIVLYKTQSFSSLALQTWKENLRPTSTEGSIPSVGTRIKQSVVNPWWGV